VNLIKEHINEKFFEDSDPISDMKIGVRILIKKWLDQHSIKSYKIKKDGTINVYSSVNSNSFGLTEFPNYIQFDRVYGSFDIAYNNFTSLRGCPTYVRKNFWCLRNKLTSLEYAPKKVGESFICWGNIKKFTCKDIEKICEVGQLIIADDRVKQMNRDRIGESINEKFSEKSDPIKDLGIGIFTTLNFDNKDDFLNFLINAIPAILQTPSIPMDMLEGRGLIKEEYFFKIYDYFTKYNTTFKREPINGDSEVFFWPEMLRNKLSKMGFKRFNEAALYEKFIEKSDPIRDLGIGSYKLQKICKDILNLDKKKKDLLISIFAYKNKKSIILNLKISTVIEEQPDLSKPISITEYKQYFIEILKDLDYFHLFKNITVNRFNIEFYFKEKYKKNILVDTDPTYYSSIIYHVD